MRERTIAAASRKCSSPFRRVRRETTADERRASGNPSSRRSCDGGGRIVEAREVDAVADDDDLRRVVALADQPVLDRVGVDENAVGEPARVALHALLHRRQVRRAVANRRDDDRRDQPRRRHREHVAVEVVGVHDVDAAADDVPRQPRLLRKRGHAAERRHWVLEQRNLALRELVDERPHRRRQANSTSNRVRSSDRRERHELVLGAAAHQRRHDVEDASSASRLCRPGSHRPREQDTGPSTACDLGAAGVLERHGKPGDAEEIELIGDRVKHRRDEKRDERDLDAGRERRELRERWIACAPGVPLPTRCGSRADAARRTAGSPGHRDRRRTADTRCGPSATSIGRVPR